MAFTSIGVELTAGHEHNCVQFVPQIETRVNDFVSRREGLGTAFASVNGQISTSENAKLSLEDRGLQFAESAYEVIGYRHGRPFRLAAHLARLERSTLGIGLSPAPLGTLPRAINELVARSGLDSGSLYIQITGGSAPRRHVTDESIEPTVIVLVYPDDEHVSRQRAISCILVPDDRWARCHVKTTALLANVLAKKEAHRRGADDSIFVRDGYITEATSSNVFVVQTGSLITAPISNYLLEGITRNAIIDLAKELGIGLREAPLSSGQLVRGSEIFLTSTLAGVVPVVVLDSVPIGDGNPGPVTSRLSGAFDDLVERETS